jgi:hypothetical protein
MEEVPFTFDENIKRIWPHLQKADQNQIAL